VSVSSATAAPQKGGIVVFGETADWAVLQGALDLATGKLPPVWVVCSKEAGFPERPDVAVYNETDDEAMLKFILAARVVVFPHGGVDDTPEGQRALARDLRWLSVAAAAGRPVVAVRGPGVADHVRQDHTGFMVSPASPKALSEAMRRVANEVNRYLRYEKASRAVGKAASVAAWADEIVSGVSPAQTASSRTKWRQHPAW
jgi:glycosyltransferase involved in cell wall biosynthesis